MSQPTRTAINTHLERLQVQVMADPARAWTELQEVRVQAAQLGDPGLEAQVLVMQSSCLFYQGNYPDMLELAQEAAALSQQVRARRVESRALSSAGLARQRLGDPEGAMTAFLQSLRLCAEELDEEGTSRALLNIASLHVLLGEFEQAVPLHEQALAAAQACGNEEFIADALTRLLEDHFRLEHVDRALHLADEAVGFAQERGLTRYECASRHLLSRLLLRLGRTRAALIHAQTGLRAATRTQDRESQLELTLAVGQGFLALGEQRVAEGYFQEGLRLAEELQHRDIEWQLHEALARTYDQLSEGRRAAYHHEQCQELYGLVYGQGVQRRTLELAARAVGEWQKHPAGPKYPWTQELNVLTERLHQTRSELAVATTHDPLTSVPNRSHFQQRAQRRLNILTVGERVGFVFVTLDYMKNFNARFGHRRGDLALVEFARRLEGLVRPGDLVGRLGSDEFVIMLGGLNQPSDISRVMGRLLTGLREPFQVQGQEVNLSASMGAAVFPDDGTSLEELFRNADLALLHAKSGGRNQGQRFEANMRTEEQRRRTLLFELQGAAQRGELQLHYQGQFRLPERQIKGFEALLRWDHPELGLVPPGEFIPLAEETRLIVQLGEWVLREACRQAREWNFPERQLVMAVNVSALQIEDSAFPALVQQILRDSGVPGHVLMLELTESMMHRDPQQVGEVVRALQELNVQVSLDDFGAGFSSLSSLQTVPLNQLKIDRSFLGDLFPGAGQLPRAKLLVDMMVNLAHGMSMDIVAEGVEKDDQLQLLCDLHCDGAQGFLLARPQPPHLAQRLLGALH